MRLMGVAVWRSVLRGALISIVAGLAAPVSAQIVTATGSVKLNGDPNLVPSARKAVTFTASASSSNAVITAEAFDNLSPVAGSTHDGWADELRIKVSPNTGDPFQIILFGVKSNIKTGNYCQTSSGRTSCDPIVSFQDLGGNSLCNVGRSSFNITKARFGYGGTTEKPALVFVNSVGGTFSAQCAGEIAPITGSFNINQTTTTKFTTAPRTDIEEGTARCDGAGGWVNADGFACDAAPPIPTAELPRSGTLIVNLTAEPGANLGRIEPAKSYRWTNSDGPWFTYLRDQATDGGLADYKGSPPYRFELTLNVDSLNREKTGVFNFGFKQKHFAGIDVGTFDSTELSAANMELQINLSFCGQGVTSTYTVEEFVYDCEFAGGGLPPEIGAPPNVVHVVPHLRAFKVSFRTKCGDEKGAFKGSIVLKDNPSFDCGFPPSTGGGGSTGGDGGTGTGDGSGGTDSGGGTGGSTGGSTGGTPSNGPTVIIPDSARSGIQLNNQQSVTVDLTTAIPSSFDADVELSAFSEPEGLAVSLSKSAIAAPGTGTSVLTIAAGADTRPQDYRVIISATGNGVTTYSVIKVSVFCDPPVIFGIDQPRNVTINSGTSTTLEVKTSGSPAVYQWYAGQTGSTQNPIPGATNKTFSTGTLTSTKDYWVRATNPCGSVDSNTVTVTVH